MDFRQIYLNKLSFLIRHFDDERRERFYPFYLVLGEKKKHRRFKEALSIGRYFLDNAFMNTENDALFSDILKSIIDQYPITDTDYWNFSKKTPIPMQDYLKVVYDLNAER